MKKTACILLIVSMPAALLTGCGGTEQSPAPSFDNVDYVTSPYKHLNNGGVTEDDPVSITAYANDGYKNDPLSVFYLDGFVNGVADESGNSKRLLLCYAVNGLPLVDNESHEGYTGLAGNFAGPLRAIAEGNQGAPVKYCVKLVATVPGSGKINIDIDPSIFEQE